MAEIRHRCDVLEALTKDAQNPIAIAVIENDGDIIMLKLLNVIVKRIPRGIMDREKTKSVTSICIWLLHRFFQLKAGVLRKSVRAGLLTFLAKLIPFYDGRGIEERETISESKLIFTESIPQDLIWIKSVVLLADIVKKLALEDRKILSEGILGQQWKYAENLLIERLVYLRFNSREEKLMRCEAVGCLFVHVTTIVIFIIVC